MKINKVQSIDTQINIQKNKNAFLAESDNILKPIFISINNIQLIFKRCFNLFLTLFENNYA